MSQNQHKNLMLRVVDILLYLNMSLSHKILVVDFITIYRPPTELIATSMFKWSQNPPKMGTRVYAFVREIIVLANERGVLTDSYRWTS